MSQTTQAWAGTYTAIVTPFRNGKVDEKALEQHIEGQIAGGVDGIVPVGTTGESPTLSQEEHLRVIELAVTYAKKRVKVIGGTGSNCTEKAVEMTRKAEKLGVDACLLVNPYYNKPSQPGLIAHFSAIADAVKVPLILYSIPGRTGGEIAVDTMATLAKAKSNIVGLKEAGGSVERINQLRAVLPESFALLSGDDSLTLPFMSVGAVGVVSVASNLIPKEVVAMVRAFLKGNAAEAQKQHAKLYPLFRDLFLEPNPVPVKYALSRRGGMTPDVRLPLVPLAAASQAKLDQTLKILGF